MINVAWIVLDIMSTCMYMYQKIGRNQQSNVMDIVSILLAN